ncbi:MAG: gluconokinase [Rhizobium rhizophilum]|uniref:gluconokinase n=1 Tax=Rhizobium rhizophilum TaxID=1850373 RepID=UPI00391D131E
MSLRLVIMGVAGCGKSTVGAAMSEQLRIPYQDGDDLHSADAVQKMRAGIPLDDDDRWPWLDRIAETLSNEAPLIIGCSALRRAYRNRIRTGVGGEVTFVHLAGDRDLIASRMALRSGHYMPLSLLDSQFATLERPGPDEALEVTIDQSMEAIVGQVLSHLGGNPQ